MGPDVLYWVLVLGSTNGILGVLADQTAKKAPHEYHHDQGHTDFGPSMSPG